jgi:hypothetical protein
MNTYIYINIRYFEISQHHAGLSNSIVLISKSSFSKIHLFVFSVTCVKRMFFENENLSPKNNYIWIHHLGVRYTFFAARNHVSPDIDISGPRLNIFGVCRTYPPRGRIYPVISDLTYLN